MSCTFLLSGGTILKHTGTNGVTALGGLLALGGGNIFGGLRTGDAGGVASGFRAVID